MLIPDSAHALIVGVVLIGLFITFVREWVKADVAVICALACFLRWDCSRLRRY